ncbi:hypothetical protein CC80DRAFT_503065 [Byssothecium circinans]|uniref:Uncharacterized protein n=1 Tax=Byssothecium circinans TaxID=147558 RepID=A0A6A5TZH2_9PLEO|nr:hypothetical protein CC80DRAFT_503065 [Byssothecium circinans]
MYPWTANPLKPRSSRVKGFTIYTLSPPALGQQKITPLLSDAAAATAAVTIPNQRLAIIATSLPLRSTVVDKGVVGEGKTVQQQLRHQYAADDLWSVPSLCESNVGEAREGDSTVEEKNVDETRTFNLPTRLSSLELDDSSFEQFTCWMDEINTLSTFLNIHFTLPKEIGEVQRRRLELQNLDNYANYLDYEAFNGSAVAPYLYIIYIHVAAKYSADPVAIESPPFAQLHRVALRLTDVDSVAFRGGGGRGWLTTSVINWVMEATEEPRMPGAFYLPINNFPLYQGFICPDPKDHVYPTSSPEEVQTV